MISRSNPIQIGGPIKLPGQGNQSSFGGGPIIPPTPVPSLGPQRTPGQASPRPADWSGQVDAWRSQGRPNKINQWM